jgi:SAM-dependent methyltransferase
MLDQIDSAVGVCAVQNCDICQTPQNVPGEANAIWKCRLCGQEYRSVNGGMGKSIKLSDRQLAALRNLSGRDGSGRSTIVTNWWTENQQQEKAGEDFLDYNKDKPARHFCRKVITDLAAAGEIKSVLEVAFGGLHEYRAMQAKLRELDVTYSGIDWTEHFVAHAQKEFPECRWNQGDIARGVVSEEADVVYSQHMLEHLPALEPAFSNMLRLARKTMINIFFIPPKPFENYEVVNWQHYPLYHNTYSVGHIEKICRAMKFNAQWVPFPGKPGESQLGGLGEDVVLIAQRQ